METLNLIKNDPWLEPFADAINGRHQHAIDKESELTNKGKLTLSDFASGYLYFGLHRTDDGWVFREWAPNATQIFMVGTFNDWKEEKKYSLKRKANGNWEIKLPADAVKHGDLYIGTVVAVNAFLHGLHVSYKTNRLKYSVPRFGLRRNPIK